MLSRWYLIGLLLGGCRRATGAEPRALTGLFELEHALTLCGASRGPEPCDVQAPFRHYIVTFAPAGEVCKYAEYRLVPLTAFDSTFRAAVDTFAQRFGQSQLIGNRFHQWPQAGFIAFASNQRADYNPPGPEDSLGAVITGYSLAGSENCPR